jgi:hypothetical protein
MEGKSQMVLIMVDNTRDYRCFKTVSIIRYSRELNVSETGSVSVLR